VRAKPIIPTLILCLTAHAWAAEPARPLAACPLIDPKEAPTIDGRLDEAVWARGQELSAFELVGGGPASQQTHARVLCDGQTLYLAAVCDETHMGEMDGGGIRARLTQRDSDIWTDDCIEIFIAPRPAKPDYFHFIVGAAGGIYDAREKDPTFNANVEAAVTRGDESWTVEVAIDLGSLSDETHLPRHLKLGDTVHFNLCREETPHGELSSWSAGGGGFHSRNGFGDLIVGSLSDRQVQLLLRLNRALASARAALAELDSDRKTEFSKLEVWAAHLREKAAEPIASSDREAFIRDVELLERNLKVVAMSRRSLLIWEPPTWQLPMPEDLPAEDVEEAQAVEVWTFRNEWESHALAVTNLKGRDAHCRVVLTDFQTLDTATTVPAQEILTVRTPVPSRLSSGARMLDALPLLQEGSLSSVGAGATQVLWLTFRTQGLDPGRYNGAITVYDLEQTNLKKHVRLTLTVYPIPLDDGPLPYTECWDHWSALKGIPLADKQQHYRDYYLNVSTVHVPQFPGYDEAAGRIVHYDSRDFSRLDRFIAETRDFTRLYLLDVQPWHGNVLLGDSALKMWSDEYNRRLGIWAATIRDHMAEQGFDDDQWAWSLQDEPGNYKALTTPGDPLYFPDTCKAIKKIDPRMQIYTTWGSGAEAAEKMLHDCLGSVDIFQTIPQHHVPQEKRDLMASRGAQVWDYHIGYKVDGYWKHRGSLPVNVTVGSRGMGFWSWTNYQGLSNWDSFDNRSPDGDCSVIYYEDGSIIPSLRAESFRQGVEDFKYWLMFDRAIAEAGVDAKLIERARAERKRIIGAMRTPPAPNSPQWVEDFRGTVRRQLIALGVAGGAIDPAAIRAVEETGPLCLTGNGGPRAANLHTGGAYSHDRKLANERTATGNWQMGADEPIYFRAADAPEGHPQAGKSDGALTGPGYALEFLYGRPVPSSVTVTFDLRREFEIERVSIAPTVLVRDGGATVEVKAEGDEAQWTRTRGADNVQGELDKTHGTVELPLVPRKARYVRLLLKKPPKARLISIKKVRIWGRPVKEH